MHPDPDAGGQVAESSVASATNAPLCDVVVTIVGAGAPHPAADRFGSATVIQLDERAIVVDCGPATTSKMHRSGINPTQVDGLLYTHHHFDHNAGTPALLMTRWESTITGHQPLEVRGPAGTARFIDALVGEHGAFRPDIVARQLAPISQAKFAHYGGVLPRPDLETNVVELEAGATSSIGNDWKITTGAAFHVQPFHESIAYRIEVGGKSIVITGDTEYCPEIETLAADADLLIAMCVGTEEQYAALGDRRMAQMGSAEVNRIVRAAGVKAVLLTHTGAAFARHPYREQGIREVGRGFDGDVLFADEGMRLGWDSDGSLHADHG